MTTISKRFTGLRRHVWIWPLLATAAVWLATVAVAGGQAGGQIFSAALSFATFTIIVGLGQMIVIATGPGNVDLSIPAVITLSGVIAMKQMDSENSRIFYGLVSALGVSAGAGAFNYGLTRYLRIPPIIATLSSSFLILSAAISYGQGIRIKPPPILADFATARMMGIPLLSFWVFGLTLFLAIVLARTIYGRSVMAIGQNARAAFLAGVNVERTRFITYVLSGLLAGLCGFFLSGFSGGAALDMGEEYLLSSIAVVIIGGTSVAGGQVSVPGIWSASLFLFLLVNMLNTYQASPGFRLILTGLIIIGVVTLASSRDQTK